MNLLLRTIPKSGTYYMLALIGNYVAREYFGVGPLPFPTLQTHFWEGPPSHRSAVPARPSPFSLEDRERKTGVSRFRFIHVADETDVEGFDKVVQVYRNPLDTFVSTGHYARASLDVYRDRLEAHMESYARQYNLMQSVPHALTLTYEELKKFPEATLGLVVNYMGWRFSPSSIFAAAEDSAAERLRAAETKAGVTNVFSPKAHTSHVRNGSVGQWRHDNMSWREVYRAARVLKAHGIRLNQFHLDR